MTHFRYFAITACILLGVFAIQKRTAAGPLIFNAALVDANTNAPVTSAVAELRRAAQTRGTEAVNRFALRDGRLQFSIDDDQAILTITAPGYSTTRIGFTRASRTRQLRVIRLQ